MFLFALPETTGGVETYILAAASGAFDAIGPAALNHEVEAVVGISEVEHGLLECFGLFHGVSRWPKYGRTPY